MEDNDKKHFEKRVRETTYLIQAVTMGDKFMVKKLLNGEYLKQFGKWSGDVNAQNKKGETPLTIATQNDFKEIVKLLSEAIILEAKNRLSFATSGLSPESPVNYLDADIYNKVGLLLEEKGSKRKRSRKRSKKVESKKRKKKKKTRKRRKTRKK